MKILVLSDSHSGLSFMRHCIEKTHPEHIIHLGDHYDDAIAIGEEYPHIRLHQVPGNCDMWAVKDAPEILCYDIAGVRFYMTHGHNHGVKSGLERIIKAARESKAAVVLFGHTHEPVCFLDGELLVMNPGSCRSWSGSAGVIQIRNGKITDSAILRQLDLDLCDSQDKQDNCSGTGA